MAAPSKFTPEVCQQILSALELGCRRPDAAAAANVERKTFQLWLREGRAAKSGVKRAFLDALKRAESVGRNYLLGLIRASAVKGQWQAAAWLLERRWPQWFGANQQAIREIVKALAEDRKKDAEIAALKLALPPAVRASLGLDRLAPSASAITTAPKPDEPDTRIQTTPAGEGV